MPLSVSSQQDRWRSDRISQINKPKLGGYTPENRVEIGKVYIRGLVDPRNQAYKAGVSRNLSGMSKWSESQIGKRGELRGPQVQEDFGNRI